MKMNNLIHCCFNLFLAVLGLTACSSEKDIPQTPAKEELTVDKIYENLEVDRPSKTLQVPVVTNLTLEQWNVSQEGTWFVAKKMENKEIGQHLEISVKENTTDGKRTGTITLKTASKLNSKTISITQYSDGIVVPEDIKISPVSAKASECQDNNQSIEKTLDGDYQSHFHSLWNGTKFPVTLEYFFNGENVIDYIIYYTRSGNGNFGKFSVYVATDNANSYTKIDDYDSYEKDAPTKIMIPGSLKPTAIKFEVNSGMGGFASCAEMEFYRMNTTNTLNDDILKVFTDLSCTEVRSDATQDNIDALGEYLSRVANVIRNKEYTELERDFRIRDYEAYSVPNTWRDILKTRTYSNLDNPTGISVKAGDEIVVCAGDLHGQSIGLQCIGEEKVKHENGDYMQPAQSGDTYLLKEGVNKIKIKNEGQLFVMYNVTDIHADNAKPIRIHFPRGSAVVNGFFDLKEHKTDEKYAEIISQATHKYFCIRGNSFIMYFSRPKLPQTNILGPIELWDSMAEWEQEFCGIDEFRGEGKPFNNHLFGMSPEANNNQLNLWASDYRMAFIWTALNQIVVSKEEATSRVGAMWGPGHEMGHVHQQAINWNLCTETSANVFAHYVNEKLGKYTSHGPGLRRLAQQRVDADGSWYDICVNSSNYNHINNRMWWQLYIYYTKVLGDKRWYAKVFKEMRACDIDAYSTNATEQGMKMMEFVKACAKVANEDLTDFFDLWGFFKVTNKTTVTSQDPYLLNVNAAMINETKEYLSQFPKPKHAFEYIEDRKMVGYLDGDFDRSDIGDLGFFDTYKNNPALSDNISATVSGRTVTVNNADEAVAIEIRKGGESGEILFFSNFTSFEIPSKVNTTGCGIYAVRANGERKLLAKF